MKPRKSPRRQIFVLTPEEKRVVAVVVGAFLLGLGTMHYRAKHPRTPAPTAVKEAGEKKTGAKNAKGRSPIPSRTPRVSSPPPLDPDAE
jgi:hypothetical protein